MGRFPGLATQKSETGRYGVMLTNFLKSGQVFLGHPVPWGECRRTCLGLSGLLTSIPWTSSSGASSSPLSTSLDSIPICQPTWRTWRTQGQNWASLQWPQTWSDDGTPCNRSLPTSPGHMHWGGRKECWAKLWKWRDFAMGPLLIYPIFVVFPNAILNHISQYLYGQVYNRCLAYDLLFRIKKKIVAMWLQNKQK